MKNLASATKQILIGTMLLVTGTVTYSEPPLPANATKENVKPSRKVYLLSDQDNVRESFSDKETMAYATNAIGDNGVATGREDPVLIRIFDQAISDPEQPVAGAENNVAEQ